MKNRERKRPKGDKYALLRTAPGANVPDAVPGRAGRKYADPELVLQGEVNDLLKTINQFHFRLSAYALARAGDESLGGWPDNPMIIRLAPGLALLGPLELKKPGETLRPNQVRMQAQIGTVEVDTYKAAEAYAYWFRGMGEAVRAHLRDNPPPALPAGVKF